MPPSVHLSEDLESVILDSTDNIFIVLEDGYFVSDGKCPLTEQECIIHSLQEAGCLIFNISTPGLFKDTLHPVQSVVADILHHIHKDKNR